MFVKTNGILLKRKHMKRLLLFIILSGGYLTSSTVLGQQVFNSDVFVQGSLQIGLDANSSHSFGFDTFVMSEDNLRMYFEDVSTTANFPSNDWRFTFNDSTNGGDNFFSIDDATAGTVPFKIQAGAGNNKFFMESGGYIGLGNTNPAVHLHLTDGNTPTYRLEQDGSDGFTAQTWDIAGNEANFFIRDVSNGSKLSFRIQPNTPENTLTLRASGTVGIGTFSPNGDASLHMNATDKGLLINRLTTEQRTTFGASLESGDNGMMVYDNEENKLYLWDGTQWVTSTDDQALTLTDNTLALEDGGTVNLTAYLDNTDNQDLTLTNNELSLTNDATTVDLAAYLDNTDEQTLNLNNSALSITGGNTVDLTPLVSTDDQNLTAATLTNNELTIEIENGNSVTVDLSAILAPLQNENATQQSQIDDLITRMEALEDCACTTLNVNDVERVSNKAILYQNIPNPFKNTSIIKYYVPVSVSKAEMVFSNTSGQIVSRVPLEDRGEGVLNVNSEGLPSAIYYYALYIDGKKVDSKKMAIE